MRGAALLGAIALLSAVPAQAKNELQEGLLGVIRGCEEWVLSPMSWADGTEPFVEAVNLGDRMGLVSEIAEEALPPEDLRLGNRYWRINSTDDAGFILVVSDRLPMCHITGGGTQDLQPVVLEVLASEAFLSRWDEITRDTRDGMVSLLYRSREDPAFHMRLSHIGEPNQRTDRVQIIATAVYELDD